jgi:hypothetical protein
VIINQPGASGSIDAQRAGSDQGRLHLIAGAAQDLGAYQTLGSLDTSIRTGTCS